MTEVKKAPDYLDRLPFQVPTEDPLPTFPAIPKTSELTKHEKLMWNKTQHELGHHVLSLIHEIPHDLSIRAKPEIDSDARVTLYGDIPEKAFQEIIVAPSIQRPGYIPYGTQFDMQEFHSTIQQGGPHTFQSAITAASDQLEMIDERVMNMAARLVIAKEELTVEDTSKLLKKAVWELLERGEIEVSDTQTVPENHLTLSRLIPFDGKKKTIIENIGENQSKVMITKPDEHREFTVCGLCGQGYKTAHVCKVAKRTFRQRVAQAA